MLHRCLLGLLIALLAVGEDVRAQEGAAPGAALPTDGTLTQAEGDRVAPGVLTGETATVFLTWQPSCPWVGRYTERVRTLASEYRARGVRVILVNPAPTAQSAPTDPPAPYVEDPGGEFVRALNATRTPQAFLFDDRDQLVYVGAIDDSPSGPGRVETPYLRKALDAVINDTTVTPARKNALGCALTLDQGE